MIVSSIGSERNYETVQMNRKQHLESAEINTSLMVLKDCFRMYHDNIQAHGRAVDIHLPWIYYI